MPEANISFCEYLLVHGCSRIMHSLEFKTINKFLSTNQMKLTSDAATECYDYAPTDEAWNVPAHSAPVS